MAGDELHHTNNTKPSHETARIKLVKGQKQSKKIISIYSRKQAKKGQILVSGQMLIFQANQHEKRPKLRNLATLLAVRKLNRAELDYTFADINCNLAVKLTDGKFVFFLQLMLCLLNWIKLSSCFDILILRY